MASTREAPNPLRPYYIPPSVGLPSDPLPSAPGVKGSSSSYNSGATTRSTLSSSARGILSDLDYSDYLSNSSPSATEVVKKLVDQALWKYTSVLLAQPFEVAKTVLQCHLADEGVVNRKPPPGVDKSSILYENDVPSEEDSEGDELAYFTSNRVPYSERERNSHRRRGGGEDDYHSKNTPRPASTFASDTPPHQLELRRPDALLEVISQLWTKEGAWGVWKGSNATFVYSVLLKTIESWTRSLLAAVLNAPDPGLLPRVGVGVGVISSGVADSPQPWMSLGIAVAAAGIAGVILSPLDMIRTRLILTPTTSPNRSLTSSIRHLQSWLCPPSLLPITILHSIIPTIIGSSTPILLRSQMGIDPILSPTPYSILTFISATMELFVRLPLETVLRRGQAHVSLENSDPSAPLIPISRSTQNQNQGGRRNRNERDVIVPIGPYRGISGTIWSIVREEGARGVVSGGGDVIGGRGGSGRDPRRRNENEKIIKGQGIIGLWRGWRVGMWGLVGMWGANAFGGNGGIGGGVGSGNGISEF